MPMNPGQISITRGTFNNECTVEYDLIQNQAAFPQIRDMIDYVQRRQLTTLLTSGVVTPYGQIDNSKKTRIPDVASKAGASKAIGSQAYQFRIMGRIEQTSVILGQVGTAGTDGSFSLKMQDTSLNKGDVPFFYGGRKSARVMAGPTASAGGYIYQFQTPSREVFDYSTWVTPQPGGTKWCFVSHTSFGEKSLKGYGYSKFPDMFINHMTTFRQSTSITGQAQAQVLWYNYPTATGMGKGWMFEQVSQLRAKESIRQERAAWFGTSTMKDASGNLVAVSNQIDPETGLPIIAGDGFEEQIAGGNVVYGSGTNGQPVLDDYTDAMRTLQLKGNTTTNYTWLAVTGTDGFMNAQTVASSLAGNQNIQVTHIISQEDKAGGAEANIGYNFSKMNFAGNTILWVQHPLFDDPLAYPEVTSDNKSVMGSTVYMFPLNQGNDYNMEFLHEGGNGVDRSFIDATLNGMTGSPEAVISQEDAKTYAVLATKMLNVYNTQLCCAIYPTT